jgi:hypothetical protein
MERRAFLTSLFGLGAMAAGGTLFAGPADARPALGPQPPEASPEDQGIELTQYWERRPPPWRRGWRDEDVRIRRTPGGCRVVTRRRRAPNGDIIVRRERVC